MKKRGLSVLNSFQHRISLSAVGVVAVFFVVFAVIAIGEIRGNLNEYNRIMSVLDRSALEEDVIIRNAASGSNMTPDMKQTVLDSHNKSMTMIRESIAAIGAISRQNTRMILMIIFTFIIQTVVLYVFLLVITNRFSGPIHVMKRIASEINDGKSPDMRALRRDDELKELYTEFLTMAQKLVDYEKKNRKK